MERLSNDVLGSVLSRVSNGEDRKSCSEVSNLWLRIEAKTRTSIRVKDSSQLHHFLPRFPNLTSLGIGVRISDQALRYVAECCPNLRTLELDSSQELPGDFGDEGLEAVARGCRHLANIWLLHRNIGDAGIIALQTYAKELAVLKVIFCGLITDLSLAAIGDMESITELYFMGCEQFTDSGLKSLSSGPASCSLRVLSFSICDQITDAGVFHLRRMRRLEELSLSPSHFDLTDVGGVALSAITSLKKLDLSRQLKISDDTLFAIAKGCRNLVHIGLDGCGSITGRGVVSLASSLPLEWIDISELEECHELSSYHVMQLVERCPSLRVLFVDMELEEGLSPLQREKLDGLGIVEWMGAHAY